MKQPRRAIVALACALAVALGVAAPVTARAAEDATPGTQPITLFTISSCPECNGLPHEFGTGRSLEPERLFEGAGKEWAGLKSIESSDTSIIRTEQDDSGMYFATTRGCTKAGTAYVTVTSTNGESVTVEVNPLNIFDHWDEYVAWNNEGEDGAKDSIDWTHYATLIVDDLLPDEATLQTSYGYSYVPASYTFSDVTRNHTTKITYDVSDPSVLTVSDDGMITPLKGGTVELTMTIADLAHPEATFTDTCTYTVIDDGETPGSPFDENGNLLPYTIKDGVMTFDGRPDLGEWYQLDLNVGDRVTAEGIIAGGTPWAMTIPASELDESDPLYSEVGAVNGPFFIRGDNHGSYTSLLFSYPEDKALSYQLNGSGSVRPTGGAGILLVQLSAPSTLNLSVADETVVSNEQGASISHVPNDGDWGGDGTWSALELVTEHLGGEVAQTAVDSVVAVVDGVTGHPYVYDIHLLDPLGDIFQVPAGDSVTVTLPIPEGLTAEGLRVFHVADDGTVTDMNATVDAEAGTVSFTTTHFSTFVLANVKVDETPAAETKPAGAGEKSDTSEAVPATGDPGSLAALLAAGSGALAVMTGVSIRRRR